MTQSADTPEPRPLSTELLDALHAGEVPAGIDSGDLRVAQQSGQYLGRDVTYFRIYDAARAAERGTAIGSYKDLDDHLDLVLRAGHYEADGRMVMGHGWPIGVRPPPQTPGQ